MAEQNSKRLLIISLAGLVGLWAIYKWPYTYYAEARDELQNQIDKRETSIRKADNVINRASKLPDWGRLNVDQALAENRLNNYVAEWVKQSGMTVSSFKQDRGQSDAKNQGFMVLSSRVSASGNQKSVTNLLWALARSPIPLRISEISIRSSKEGDDKLELTFGVSTLCVDPKASKDASKSKNSSGAKT